MRTFITASFRSGALHAGTRSGRHHIGSAAIGAFSDSHGRHRRNPQVVHSTPDNVDPPAVGATRRDLLVVRLPIDLGRTALFNYCMDIWSSLPSTQAWGKRDV